MNVPFLGLPRVEGEYRSQHNDKNFFLNLSLGPPQKSADIIFYCSCYVPNRKLVSPSAHIYHILCNDKNIVVYFIQFCIRTHKL